MRRAVVFLWAFVVAASMRADGGRVRLRQAAGSFAVTVFTAPEPLAAGPADVSVLVQDRASGGVVLDADVEILLRGPGGSPSRSYRTAPGTNRLLQSTLVELPSAGDWELEVTVHRGGETATLHGPLPVEPPRGQLESIWPFLAVPPVAVALFALRGALRRRRSPPHPNPLPPVGGEGI